MDFKIEVDLKDDLGTYFGLVSSQVCTVLIFPPTNLQPWLLPVFLIANRPHRRAAGCRGSPTCHGDIMIFVEFWLGTVASKEGTVALESCRPKCRCNQSIGISDEAGMPSSLVTCKNIDLEAILSIQVHHVLEKRAQPQEASREKTINQLGKGNTAWKYENHTQHS